MRTKLKNLTSIFLAVIMVFGIFAIVPFTANAATSGDFEYTVLDDGTAEITAYSGSAAELTIPSELDGYTVTSIGRRAFKGNTSFTSLIIPNSVNNLESMAFAGCGITSLTLGNGMTTVDNQAFMGCNKLASITFGKNLKTIGDRVFVSCSSLTELVIPNGVTRIGMNAFQKCTNLASVTIPDSVISIGGSAFLQTKLYDDQPDSVVYIDGWVCGYNGTMPENTSLVFKGGTRGIADKAFLSSNLENVTIPDSVTNSGTAVFDKCKSLKKVIIGDGLKKIDKETFLDCTSLTDVTIGKNVTSIGDSAFYNCSSLASITIPDGVTEIGDKAFSVCSSLESVTIPESVTSIINTAFNNHSDALTLYGYIGSAAEVFATKNGITFVNIEDVPKPTMGDVNGDGEISILDATELQKYVAELSALNDEQLAVADVNGDGQISVLDATEIQKYLAELTPSLG